MCLFLLLPLLIEPNKRLHKASSNLQSDLFRLFKIGDKRQHQWRIDVM